ncbi:hypothetical protein [Anaeromicropila populeti]|uniref:Vitamin B12 dependent methionine synthase, activation domain n=1 Tax=Anaeromicropila populeti TaxID=37658 RepID=A0A1I6JW95_9FIRM|nr:hypothetical protein [Anaeromicropila populeti]SFR83191.1 hypothetical protein SAMN05661086_02004 [Anaeromicropila populeti]
MLKEQIVFPLYRMFSDKRIMDLNRKLSSVKIQEYLAVLPSVKGIMACFSRQDFKEGRCELEGKQLYMQDYARQRSAIVYCEAWKEIDKNQLLAVMTYALTCGQEPSFSHPSDELYAHMFQTYSLDFSRKILEDNLMQIARQEYGKAEDLHILPSFGPGFFGMDFLECEKLISLLEGAKVGITTSNGMLHPLKSCVGILICIKGNAKIGLEPCQYCSATKDSCEFCTFYGGK